MAYDEELAERVRRALDAHPGVAALGVEPKAMFGGVSYMVGGAMCVGVLGDKIVARTSAEDGERYLEEPDVRPMDFTGKPMKGWLYASGVAIATDADLARWVDRCVAFARAQAAAPKKAKKPAAGAAKSKAKAKATKAK